MAAIEYKKHIDGFRSLAVLAVVLSHLDIPFFRGGYIGVDIFFVISGYLLTSIINKQITSNNFSIIDFYEKRIRRIIPAYYFLLIFTSLLSIQLLLPKETISYYKSLLSSLLYSSNFHFYFESGYFDAINTSKPLLHTWSLAVEEQFYFFLPMLLILLNKVSIKVRNTIIFTLLLSSLMFTITYSLFNLSATFYLLPSRIWEFLSGSIIALGLYPKVDNKKINETLSLIGLLSICACILVYNEYTVFPGYHVILPIFGTVLLIGSNHSNITIIGKFFSQSFLVFIGKISYSLYLWHWIFIVFVKEIYLNEITVLHKIFIFILSIIISYFSWKFIETPIRNKKVLKTKKSLILFFSLSTILFVCLSLFVIMKKGLPNRYDKTISNIEKTIYETNPRASTCFADNLSEVNELKKQMIKNTLCEAEVNQPQNNDHKVLLWGDSHSYAIFSTFEFLAKNKKFNLYHYGLSGCPPLMGLFLNSNPTNKECRNFNDLVFSNIINSKIKKVILVARWSEYSKRLESSITPHLEYTIKKLRSHKIDIWIVVQPPEHPNNIKKLIYKKLNKGKSLSLKATPPNEFYGISKESHHMNNKDLYTFLNSYKRQVQLINFNDFFCPKDKCLIYKDEMILYKDGNHISNAAAEELGEYLLNKINF